MLYLLFTTYLDQHLKLKRIILTPKIIGEVVFKNFLDLNGQELKSEFLIPSVINELIEEGKEKVQVLETESSWFGVTFKEDKSLVVSNINELIKRGVYPHKLF